MLRLHWEKLWSRMFWESVHFGILVFCLSRWIENVYRLSILHEIVDLALGHVRYPCDILRAVC